MGFGSIFKKIAPFAAIAAAPFTGGASLAGLGGSVLSTLSTAGSVLSAVNAAQGLFKGDKKAVPAAAPTPVAPAQAPAFTPQRPEALQQPDSLGAEFSAFSPDQQRSALATKGLNGGLGGEEDAYYRNLVQRSLIGDNNQVTAGSTNQFLLPIESQYFSRKGLNTSDPMQFLQGLQG